MKIVVGAGRQNLISVVSWELSNLTILNFRIWKTLPSNWKTLRACYFVRAPCNTARLSFCRKLKRLNRNSRLTQKKGSFKLATRPKKNKLKQFGHTPTMCFLKISNNLCKKIGANIPELESLKTISIEVLFRHQVVFFSNLTIVFDVTWLTHLCLIFYLMTSLNTNFFFLG